MRKKDGLSNFERIMAVDARWDSQGQKLMNCGISHVSILQRIVWNEQQFFSQKEVTINGQTSSTW